MIALLLDPAAWASLFGITLIQIALGANNLIIITIAPTNFPAISRVRAIRCGPVLAMIFRIVLLFAVNMVLAANGEFPPPRHPDPRSRKGHG